MAKTNSRGGNQLNAKEVTAAKPRDKDYKLNDGNGLILLVTKKGSKRWRFRYTFETKEKMLSLGLYPAVSLAEARKKRDGYKTKIADGIDPSNERKDKKAEVQKAIQEKANKVEHSFESVTRKYLEHRSDLNEAYLVRVRRSFENDVFPFIGKKELKDITPKDVIDIVKLVESRGATESAHRLITNISRVFKHGISNMITELNPCNNLVKSDILKPHQAKSFPTITDPQKIGMLLNVIDGYEGDYTTRMILRLAPHVFLRPHTLRHAEWSEIDFDNRVWRIPAEKMKTKKGHLVPLTDATLAIFTEMYNYSGDARYIFHSLRSKTSPMSDNTMNGALRRMGYTKDEIVPHGFRAMFSTIAHEISGFRPEVIETQLAHSVGSKVAQAYNRALYLDERKELMQWWSAFLMDQAEKVRKDG